VGYGLARARTAVRNTFEVRDRAKQVAEKGADLKVKLKS